MLVKLCETEPRFTAHSSPHWPSSGQGQESRCLDNAERRN